jgi:glycosyltransferase involved in cell wall biosynthesis
VPGWHNAPAIEDATGRPSALMKRGVDTDTYHPLRRNRNERTVRIGYSGRLSPEKGVRWLADVERRLLDEGFDDFEIWIAGHGNETEWLRQHVHHARLTGVLRGAELARFYADLDLFAFPSETDTYGNVVQEAMASGVPCVVTSGGGPKFLVHDKIDGEIAVNRGDFTAKCANLARDPARRARMARCARQTAERAAWPNVMEDLWTLYATCSLTANGSS